MATAAFKSLRGATTSWIGSYLSHKLGVIARPFSYYASIPLGNEVIGIDLGTTYSRVAVMEGETAKVIKNAQGSLSTPSVVSFNKKGELIVGTLAKHQVLTNLTNTIFRTKRFIGRRFDDSRTQKEMGMVPYNIVNALNGDAWVEANGHKYSPAEIGAFVLSKMKETAEAYLGTIVNKAVISVPGYFSDAQRQATKDAGQIAGLDVQEIIDDPVAVAYSYGFNNKEGLIAVFDLGGGTFDISILKIVDTVDFFMCAEKARNGDVSLGGVDFDDAIMDFLITEFKRTHGMCLTNDKVAIGQLREAAEKIKIVLSTKSQSDIYLPSIKTDASGAKHLNVTVTRSTFEAQVNHLIERIKSRCKKCIEDARITTDELDEVLLVGGMDCVPIVQEVVKEIFGKTPIRVVNPDEAVAKGAAILGYLC